MRKEFVAGGQNKSQFKRFKKDDDNNHDNDALEDEDVTPKATPKFIPHMLPETEHSMFDKQNSKFKGYKFTVKLEEDPSVQVHHHQSVLDYDDEEVFTEESPFLNLDQI